MINIIWYQAGEDLKEGDYAICLKDPTIMKWDGKTHVPIGKAIHTMYTSKYKWGDRVPVVSIWYCGRLAETLKIGDRLFVIGEMRDYIERAVRGDSDDEIYGAYEKKNMINEIIYKLKKMRDEL